MEVDSVLELFLEDLQSGSQKESVVDLKMESVFNALSTAEPLPRIGTLTSEPPPFWLCYPLTSCRELPLCDSAQEIRCPVCLKVFPTLRGMKSHKNYHYRSYIPSTLSKKRHKCDICFKCYVEEKTLIKHKQAIHNI